MNKTNVLKLLFITGNNNFSLNIGLLFTRLFVGSFMLIHGLQKLLNFQTLALTFPDPIGLGSAFALILIIFAEFFCSILLIVGLFSRLATIPLIIGMSVAAFFAYAGQAFMARELPLIYICIYISLLILGPGNISLDNFISKKLSKIS